MQRESCRGVDGEKKKKKRRPHNCTFVASNIGNHGGLAIILIRGVLVRVFN